MISTVTNRGRLSFMVFEERFTSRVFLEFLGRLLRQSPQKVYLIVDGHPVHRSRAVQRWLEEHAGQIRLFRLPAYSPELNPDELLNQDVKTNAVGRQRPSDQRQMIAAVRSYVRNTQRQPRIVRAYFSEEHVRYAA
jgi:transposase